MSLSTSLGALVGMSLAKRNKEHPLEPFKRSLELAKSEQDKAVDALRCATEELLKAVNEQKESRGK